MLSEYPYETQPRPYQFPERNRLISGAALATIMVEGGERSGSLITARMALEQGREVFAVPGSPLSEVSKGCHRMIRQGAALATSADEVMEEMGWFVPLEENTAGLSTEGGDEPIAGAGAGRGNLALPETGFNQNSKEIIVDYRPNNIIRIALTPLYTSFEDIYYFCFRVIEIIKKAEFKFYGIVFVHKNQGPKQDFSRESMGQNSTRAKNILSFDEFAKFFWPPSEKMLWGPGEPHFFKNQLLRFF